MKMITIINGTILSLMLTGCSHANVKAGESSLFVYKTKGAIQCESKGITLQQSVQELDKAGIKAEKSHCAIMTGMSMIAMCGAGTSDIIVHKIDAKNLVNAKTLGFDEAKKLIDEKRGLNYKITQCKN